MPRAEFCLSHLHRNAAALCLVALACSLLLTAGCRRAHISPEAEPWPAKRIDVRETGENLSRWPAFRGHNSQGIAPGGSPPVDFDAGSARWQVTIPGSGNSSPVVWDDTIFLTTAEGDRRSPELYLLAYDRASGRLRWKVRVGPTEDPTHAKNGHASASVTTDGQRVYAFFGSAGLYCYDMGGQFVWHADLGRLEHIYGTASSPILYEGAVIQLCDSETDSYLAAFDTETGERLWRTPRASNGCWTTPVLVTAETDRGTRDELLVNGGDYGSSGRLTAYDPRTGDELWYVEGTTELVTPVALAAGELVFSLSGRNGPIMAVRPGGSGNVGDSHLLWRLPRGGPYIPSGVVYRNRLYVLTDRNNLACYNPGNGEEIWTARISGQFTSSLIAADGRLYACSEQGSVYVFEAGDQFHLLAENELPGKFLATPAVVEGDLILRSDTTLYCFAGEAPAEQPPPAQGGAKAADGPAKEGTTETPGGTAALPNLPAGAAWPLFRGDAACRGASAARLPDDLDVLWIYSEDDESFSASPVVSDGLVLVGGMMGRFVAVDLESGELRWDFDTEGGFLAPAAVKDGAVYVGDIDGRFRCLELEDGTERWHFQSQSEIDNSANFFGDNVIFGSQDFFLYCLDAATGEQVWAHESDDQIRCCPPVVDAHTLVAGCNGFLHVIDLDDGSSVRKAPLQGPTGCTPAVDGNTAYVGTEDGRFFAIDWQAGEVLWEYSDEASGDSFRSSAALTAELAIVGSRDKRIHAFDRKTGKPRWQHPTRRYVDASPLVVGDRVFAPSMDGRLYCLRASDGELLWERDLGAAVSASPAVVDGRLIVATEAGDVYCFGAK